MNYRVWSEVHRRSDSESEAPSRTFVPVRAPAVGYELIETLRDRLESDPRVVSSEFGLEILSLGEWKEWYDGDGFDVFERFGNGSRRERWFRPGRSR